MILKHKIFALLAIVLFAFTSCKKDKDNVDPQIGLNQKAIEYLASGYWYDSSTNAVYQYDVNEDKKGGAIKIVSLQDSKPITASTGNFSVLDNNNFKFDNEWKVTTSTESKITFNKVVDGKTTEDTAVFTKIEDDKVIDQIIQSYLPQLWKHGDNPLLVTEYVMNEDKVSGDVIVYQINDGTLEEGPKTTFTIDGLKIKIDQAEFMIEGLSKESLVLAYSNNDPKREFTKYNK